LAVSVDDVKGDAMGDDAMGDAAYARALAILESALVFGIKPSLDGIGLLCEDLGNPQSSLRCVQVAGTNGKSSTARWLAALLNAAGLRTGLFTSPELTCSEERIEVDGRVIPRGEYGRLIIEADARAAALVERGDIACITEFELLTAAALTHFAGQQVDVAVLEVGMGGRWDATSIVEPDVAVITGIAIEHAAILGATLEEIAHEKAAIIRPGCVPVLGPGTQPVLHVFLEQAAHCGVTPRILTQQDIEAFAFRMALSEHPHIPAYQHGNIALAVLAANAALGDGVLGDAALGDGLSQAAIRQVLAATVIPGRFEQLRTEPLLIIDAAHNPQSAQVLATELRSRFGDKAPATLLLAILADKDADGIIAALAPQFDDIMVTRSASARAIKPEQLAVMAARHGDARIRVATDVREALDILSADKAAVIATGSITLAGEVKRLFI
jgi:dihydrofolate synthase/folylpolyglutamate synthase